MQPLWAEETYFKNIKNLTDPKLKFLRISAKYDNIISINDKAYYVIWQ